MEKKIVILGAGPTGLGAAYRLKDWSASAEALLGQRRPQVLVVEPALRVLRREGGLVDDGMFGHACPPDGVTEPVRRATAPDMST